MKRLLKHIFTRLGYVVWRRDFMRYGVDPFLDIARLARRRGMPIRTVFDVGANIGQTSREALKAFPDARVFAFEPHPKTFSVLAHIDDSRLTANNLALGSRPGEVTLYEFGQDDSAGLRNSLVNNAPTTVEFGYRSSEIEVPCDTLDLFCQARGLEGIDYLKIDVEGFELSVLRGASGLLAAGKIGFIYAEFNDLLPIKGATGGALLPLAEFLAPYGMRFVATYTDFIEMEGRLFVVANALWAHRPG